MPLQDDATRHRAPATVEPAGFQSFYRSNWLHTVRLAHLLTGDGSTAEDIAQDAFVRMRRNFDAIDNPQSYLHTVTVNVARSWQRTQVRDRVRSRKVATPDVAPPASRPDGLLDVVDGLPFRQRAVVVLRYWIGLSEAEIAERLNCRPGTVKSLNSRALATLRQEIIRDD